MEYEEKDAQEGNFIQRLKDSPRTVSALIIILIIAAAIYAFSGDNQVPEDEVAVVPAEEIQEDATPTPAPDEDDEEGTPATSPATSPEVRDARPTPTTVTPEDLRKQAEGAGEARKTDAAYVEVAVRGDGVTHLARRAATRYLADNSAGYNVTNEHRIYIEDYIKDRIGKKSVAIGQEETISFDLLKEAVESAGNLTEGQLRNLTKYVHVLN